MCQHGTGGSHFSPHSTVSHLPNPNQRHLSPTSCANVAREAAIQAHTFPPHFTVLHLPISHQRHLSPTSCANVAREAAILAHLSTGYVGIATLIDQYEDATCVHFILQLCTGVQEGWCGREVECRRGGVQEGWSAGGVVCRRGGVQEGWSAGGVVCRRGGVQEGWCAGGVVCRRGGVVERWNAGGVECRRGGVQEGWCAGGVECRRGGVQEGWCAGGVECRRGGVQEGWCAGGVECRRGGVQEGWCAGGVVCRRGGVQEGWCAGGVVCRRGGVLEGWCAGGVVCRRGGVQEGWCAGGVVCWRGGVQEGWCDGGVVCRRGGVMEGWCAGGVMCWRGGGEAKEERRWRGERTKEERRERKGGMLYDGIKAEGSYSEQQAAGMVRQIVQAVQYMHGRGVMHRDLKLENFLLLHPGDDAPLMAIDFGLSTFFEPGQRFKEVVGSAYYVAPEVLRRDYGSECDVWSIGVITYMLLCGTPPFWDVSEEGICEAVLKGEYEMSSPPWPAISQQAKHLVGRMLDSDAARRITTQEILGRILTKNSWPPFFPSLLSLDPSLPFSSTFPFPVPLHPSLPFILHLPLPRSPPPSPTLYPPPSPPRSPPPSPTPGQVVAGCCLDENEMAAIRTRFDHLDLDRDGCISVSDLVAGFQSLHIPLSEEEAREIIQASLHIPLSEEEAREIIQAVSQGKVCPNSGVPRQGQADSKGSGTLDLSEYASAIMVKRMDAARIEKAFRHFDKEGRGYITMADLKATLAAGESDETVERLFKEIGNKNVRKAFCSNWFFSPRPPRPVTATYKSHLPLPFLLPRLPLTYRVGTLTWRSSVG
ncbi:unnamed protein product [Closterium sp. Naga37s-1]|nr:unnamed protein product [Closterium sp. Naga37s-1]